MRLKLPLSSVSGVHNNWWASSICIWIIKELLNTEAFWIITVYYHSEVGRVISVARNVGPGITQGYVRHRPENTQLYQIIDKYYPDFQLSLAEQDKRLPTNALRWTRVWWVFYAAVAWNMVFCGRYVMIANTRSWSPLVASVADFVQIVDPAEWSKVPHC